MASLKALTGDSEVDEILRYLRGCDAQDRAARLTAENVHVVVSLLDHLFTATAGIPAVQRALVDLFDVAGTDKLIKLLVKLDPDRKIEQLAEVA